MMRPQKAIYGENIGVDLRHMRYDQMVEALGGHGELVEKPEDIQPALERAFASGKPALVNVILETDRTWAGGGYV